MSKGKKELLKVQHLIEHDRLKIKDNFSELLICDIDKLLKDYFEFKGIPELSIKKCGDRLKVEVSIFASRLRSFECLAKK